MKLTLKLCHFRLKLTIRSFCKFPGIGPYLFGHILSSFTFVNSISMRVKVLPVTNDKFTLSTTNGHQRVDGFDTGLHGLADRLTGDDT